MRALVALLCSVVAATASAQEPEGEESEELRALRLAEHELFGAPTPARTDLGSAVQVGVPASAVSSSVTRAEPRATPVHEGDRELLEGLVMPDIPVEWDRQVLSYLRFYRDDPRGQNIIRAWFTRARTYAPMVRGRLRALSMPEDLLYVAMIESGFDPRARSGAGAVGMWQFVRSTGEEYGLRFDHWLDERMDPEKSTDAGARYLEDLRRRFGSWELALAAYNMGYGALLRAMRKYNTNDYQTLVRIEAGLPYETTFYVAKVMACAIIGRNPARFGLGELALEPEPTYRHVEVDGGTPLGPLARAAGLDVERMADLNPALRRRRVPPGGRYSLRIPAGEAGAFERNLARIAPRLAPHREYVVRFGETLEEIATRFRTTESDLRRENELAAEARLGAGMILLVPPVEPRDVEGATDRPVAIVPAERFEQAGRRRVFYRVVSGDTLSEIAQTFRVSVDELATWNPLDVDAVLLPGMILQVYPAAATDLARVSVLAERDVRILELGSEEFFDYQEAALGRVRFRYRIRNGDTLEAIAERFGLSVGSVCRINRFGRDVQLREGQEILIYAARNLAPESARREADERLRAYAIARGENPPPVDAPAVADDGDGEDEAADGPATPEPAAAPEPAEPGG
jgi:membrane-bound lytic murein transglycosylase D